ncbi:MAG: hypothetical protein JWQ34_2114 [Mucilaginibacter sp.]|uniref:hypothetical protein n=1 Tax=Mucilaginibacter sp. TaxID=1882438 RepID=UPI00260D15A4|nr:hypothetical protein [Mucilaginibacter sp.]MDB5003889.1 hypothetical protein [Mucilaginibacter sp.]
MITELRTLDDVKEFILQLIAEGLNYHPDDDFENYVNTKTGGPSYTWVESKIRNRLNDQSFETCEAAGTNIYDISMEIFLKETGLDKYIPPPSQALIE